MNQNAAGSGEPDEVPDSGAGDNSAAMHSSPATLVSPSTEEPTWTTSTPTTTDYTGSGWIGTFVGTVPAAGGDAAGDTHTYIFTDDDPIDGRMIITGAIGGSCEYSLSQNSRTDATTASLQLTLINGDGCRTTDAEATLTRRHHHPAVPGLHPHPGAAVISQTRAVGAVA